MDDDNKSASDAQEGASSVSETSENSIPAETESIQSDPKKCENALPRSEANLQDDQVNKVSKSLEAISMEGRDSDTTGSTPLTISLNC